MICIAKNLYAEVEVYNWCKSALAALTSEMHFVQTGMFQPDRPHCHVSHRDTSCFLSVKLLELHLISATVLCAVSATDRRSTANR